MSRERLICDTSFVSHFLRLDENPDRYTHWDEGVIHRVESELLAISVVTVAELRAGYLKAGWGTRRVAGRTKARRVSPALARRPAPRRVGAAVDDRTCRRRRAE